MRIISLDVGEKRIGVARADSTVRIAIPVTTIEVNGNEYDEIARLMKLYGTNFVVLGLPRSNEGNETAQSLYVRNFSRTLSEKIPDIKVRFQDESLTSVEAEKRLKARKKTYEKGEIDAEAAAIILQDFIETFEEKHAAAKTTTAVERGAEKAALNSKKLTENSKKVVKGSAKLVAKESKKVVKKSKRVMRKFFIIIPILLVLGLSALGAFFWYQDQLKPAIEVCPEDYCADIDFVVNEGDTKDIIANHLAEQGLIKNSFAFKIYTKLNYGSDTFKTGAYVLNPHMEPKEIITTLIQGSKSSDVFRFTILPGETIFSIQKKLYEAGFSEEEIEEAFNDPYEYASYKPKGASVEGYLYGETFEFYQGTTVKQIIERFMTAMENAINDNNLPARLAEKGLSVHEAIILASIVQKESRMTPDNPTVPNDEQKTIAQIFLKRYRLGMSLGSDVTVSYALDAIDPYRERYDNNADALTIESCYNTRNRVGLPCGPISNPSLSALLAVVEPAETDYLFFLTGDDGKMYYGYTEAEHNQNIRDHCKVLCNVSL